MSDDPDLPQSSSKPKRKRKSKKRNPENKKIVCNDCGRKFYFPCQLDFHKLVHTGEKPYICDICQKGFNTPYSLKTHKYIHSDEKPFKCAYCKYACRDSSTLRKHQANHTGEYTMYACKLCDKSFRNKYKLKMHVAESHMNVDLRKIPCPKCDKLFKTNSNLNMHIKLVHDRAKSGRCPVCGVHLSNIGNLGTHLSTHVDARPYMCAHPGCSSAFKDRSSLRKHTLKHSRSTYLPCDICGRLYPTRARLHSHLLTVHGKVKRVQCDYCSLRFYSKAYLIKHISTKHVPKRETYICDYCGFASYNKPGLVMHIKTCYNHKDRECKICHTIYKKHIYLKAHYKRTHNISYKTKSKSRPLEIKEEPIDDDDAMSVHSIDLFEIDKTEPEEESNLEPPAPPALDTVVECERVNIPQQVFDEFYVQHVSNDSKKEVSNKTKCDIKIDKKALEYVKKTKVKMLAEARRKEALAALERARRVYNERMKKYVEKNDAAAKNKQPIKIKLFKKKQTKPSSLETDLNVSKIEDDEKVSSKNDNLDDEHKTDVIDNEIKDIDSKISNDDNNEIVTDCKGESDDNVVNVDDKLTEANDDITKVDDKLIKADNDTGDVDDKLTITNDDTGNVDDKLTEDKVDDELIKADKVTSEEDNDDDEDWTEKKEEKNRKVNYNSHQCYICFKLFDTKENLLDHCKNHFDVCNERFLKKCPLCPYVTKQSIANHLRLKHGVSVKVPYNHIQDKKDNNNGCRYYFELNDPLVHKMEVIPSIKNLNKIASMKIDKKRREDKDKTLAKTKLVRNGDQWVVETEKIKVVGDVTMPELDNDVVKNLDKVGDSDAYLDGLKKLSRIAKKSGKSMLFPCQNCEKVCLNFAGLKLHTRKHEANPKPFKKKVWKHKLKGKAVEKKPVKTRTPAPENRTAKPKPIKNKHKCDPELKQFYEDNIRGGDIEFWQFLKIFNKMSRDNIEDFKDLESRHEYGIVLPEDRTTETTEVNINTESTSNNDTEKAKHDHEKRKGKSKIKIRLKGGKKNSNNRFTIEVYKKRNLIKQKLRENIIESSQKSQQISN